MTALLVAIILITLILMIIFKPNIQIKFKQKTINLQTFWIVALVGVVLLICFKQLSTTSILKLFDFSQKMNPFKILILFISVSLLSIVLEEANFFEFCAVITLKKIKHSQIKLFIFLYLLVSILTMFTSNDIVILTLTPFILYFCKKKELNPIPYLVGEFVSANSLSLMFIIGNPTNIYIATFYNIGFFAYFKVMFIPTLLLSLTGFLICFLLFYKQLRKPIKNDSAVTLKKQVNKHLIIVGLIHLILCTILLVLSSYLGFEMWAISLCFTISVTLYVFCYDIFHHEHHEASIYKKAPWSLVPFVLSMFLIVSALDESKTVLKIATLLAEFTKSKFAETFGFGFSSFFTCSLINNIPMSVAFSSLLEMAKSSEFGMYAVIIGSNLGAILTPMAALAGIMWLAQIHSKNIKYSFLDFIKNGLIIAIPQMLVGLFFLYLVLK